MRRLPRADGDKHVAAFKRAGWRLNHIEGSHHMKKIIVKAGLTNEEYIDLFYGRKRR